MNRNTVEEALDNHVSPYDFYIEENPKHRDTFFHSKDEEIEELIIKMDGKYYVVNTSDHTNITIGRI